jgi:putative spermidine/putrescine transport system permease protein
MGRAITPAYFAAAVDMRFDGDGNLIDQPEYKQIYKKLFWRTIEMSILVTVACIALGYPIAYLLATLPMRISNLLMIMVLLPFWTSLLVRTTSWIVILGKEGVLNETLVWLGIIADDNRLDLMFNATGVVIAMTHILLPFMVLPLYSVMKTIPPSYMRAALSLGANPVVAFWRVYVPQTVPGIGAGSILVFIVAIGYYITPALVGGSDGQMISNLIAYHMQKSLNWGLAAALGTILLAGVLALYWLYNKIVGIDNMKFG